MDADPDTDPYGCRSGNGYGWATIALGRSMTKRTARLRLNFNAFERSVAFRDLKGFGRFTR